MAVLEHLTKDNFVDHPPFFTVYDYWYNLLVDRVKLYNPTAGVNIQPYHVRWPIPRSFVQLTGFPQNEGYN